MSDLLRLNQSPLKVVGVGLARTGTLSLCYALERLGFGPCYHPLHVPKSKAKWVEWTRVLEGEDDPGFIDSILEGFTSAMDSPVAAVADAIYRAYPNAKFILTVRDPDKWLESIEATMLVASREYNAAKERKRNGTATDKDRQLLTSPPHSDEVEKWGVANTRIRFNGQQMRDNPDPRTVFHAHNEWIKGIIPAEKLLIFDVKEGWEPLSKFLDVSEPEEPFPKVNQASEFRDNVKKAGQQT